MNYQTETTAKKRVAFVHDWLVSYRGGEKVLEALLELYPDAPVYTLFYDKQSMPDSIKKRKIKTLFFLRPFKKLRKALLPIYPLLIECMPTRKYDLIISTSSCVAKSAPKGRHAKHICYIHSPMRYIWDQEDIYLEPFKKLVVVTPLVKFINRFLRKWDVWTAKRVDAFICNSTFVSNRVKKFYGVESSVLHPPIEKMEDVPPVKEKSEYYIAAGAFVWYKRFDLAIAACERLNKKLVIAGNGPYESKLREIAGPSCELAIKPPDSEFRKLISEAKALLFPGIEDFGMIAIEAMRLGTPVIAYKDGGALDFVKPDETGLFFENQDVNSLCEAIEKCEKTNFKATELHNFANNFNKNKFLERFQEEISKCLNINE